MRVRIDEWIVLTFLRSTPVSEYFMLAHYEVQS
jgi:hypothetical protein